MSFFGKDLGKSLLINYVNTSLYSVAKDEEFMVSALAYIEETLICAEIVRLLPSFLSP